ncbi:MAG: hypothetical protein PW843_24440 [Azospirillaceae bacterium]|nr:hypothetical protein [Azospirillaceae bacterium]
MHPQQYSEFRDETKFNALLKAAFDNPLKVNPELLEEMAKVWQQSTNATQGLTYYDVQAPAVELVPMLTPLLNAIPRDVGGLGIQANWKAITGVNVTSMSAGVAQGRRGGQVVTQTADYSASFRGLGLEDAVTFEAQMAGKRFQDVRATMGLLLIKALKLAEEKIVLAGNTSLKLGTTPTPTVVASNAGGALTAGTWSVICAALTFDGLQSASVGGGVLGQVTRQNAGGTTETYGGGTAKLSAAATGATTGAAGSVTATVTSVPGAFGYAWFWGAAGSEVLGAITTINSVAINAAATGTQTAASLGALDNSTNNLVYDGLLTQVLKSGAGYFYAMPTGTAGVGTPLTADGKGGIVEIENALRWFWDNFRVSPTCIWVSSQEQTNITNKVLSATSNGAKRLVINTEQGNVVGGDLVTGYLNRYASGGSKVIPIRQHPDLTPGTILFDTDMIPYAVGFSNPKKILLRQDYNIIDWTITQRQWEAGIYLDGVLQNYAPFAFGAITNIANG